MEIEMATCRQGHGVNEHVRRETERSLKTQNDFFTFFLYLSLSSLYLSLSSLYSPKAYRDRLHRSLDRLLGVVEHLDRAVVGAGHEDLLPRMEGNRGHLLKMTQSINNND